MKNFKKQIDVTAHIGRINVNPKPRFVGTHNCQESQLIGETCIEIKEDRNGNQYVTEGTRYRCPICGATFRKEEE